MVQGVPSRQAILRGINRLPDAVKTTLGSPCRMLPSLQGWC